MIIRTSELKGAALDWAVAKALGAKAVKKARFTNFGEDMELFDWFGSPVNWWADSFHPSTDWVQGGPLTERYIGLTKFEEDDPCEPFYAETRCANLEGYANGATLLIAAMRAIVAAEIGDEVDVPDELVVAP